jgi:hypothetical protein
MHLQWHQVDVPKRVDWLCRTVAQLDTATEDDDLPQSTSLLGIIQIRKPILHLANQCLSRDATRVVHIVVLNIDESIQVYCHKIMKVSQAAICRRRRRRHEYALADIARILRKEGGCDIQLRRSFADLIEVNAEKW